MTYSGNKSTRRHARLYAGHDALDIDKNNMAGAKGRSRPSSTVMPGMMDD